jgi:hypothetical protein
MYQIYVIISIDIISYYSITTCDTFLEAAIFLYKFTFVHSFLPYPEYGDWLRLCIVYVVENIIHISAQILK